MLKNDNCIRFSFPNFGSHSFKYRYTTVVFTPSITFCIGKTFCKVETKSIYFVFFHPICTNTVYKCLSIFTLVIEIISPRITGVRRCFIVPRIIGCRIFIATLIHSHHRALSIAMIQYHIHYHSNTIRMACVNKCFIVVGCTICFICSKIE